MKRFIFDQLVSAENICNLTREKAAIERHIVNRDLVVIYAPRNFGKTSLIKNVVIPEFRSKNNPSFTLFADLMEVRDMDSLVARLQNAFERSFADSFPIRNLVENIKRFLSGLKPDITVDPVTSQTGISLKITPGSKEYSISFLFHLIKQIAAKASVLVALDEFQDVVKVNEAQAMFRQAFEDLGDVPIIVMGSQKHILSDIFSKPHAPLAFWGNDLPFQPIAYQEYHDYIQERFDQRELKIDPDCSKYLQDLLWRIPEPINVVSHQIYSTYQKKEVKKEHINLAIAELLENKKSRYETHLAGFSAAEEKVCMNLARLNYIEKPQSKEFVSACQVTSRTVGKIFRKFRNKGIIEKTDSGYRLSDPLLKSFFNIYR